MTRQDFIFRLFDNGNGLTLNQIEAIEENYLTDIIEEDMISAVMNDDGMSRNKAIDILKPDAREVVIDQLASNEDMLALRDHLNGILFDNMKVTDHQVYSLYFAICREN